MLLLTGMLFAPPLLQEPEHASPDLRFELGKRVRQMEVAFERAKAKPELRREALPHIEKAVSSFFSIDFPGAARALDEARGVLANWEQSEYDCLAVTPNAWILEPGESYRLTTSQIYPAELPAPLVIRVAKTEESFEVEALPFTYDYGPIALPEGPYGTRRESYGFSYGERTPILSANPEVIPDARARARAVQEKRKERDAELAPWVRTTTRYHLEMLSEMMRGSLLETRLPGELLLTRSETLLEADQEELQMRGMMALWLSNRDDRKVRTRSGAMPGQDWIALPRGGGRDQVRLLIPGVLESKRPPLVIALHGAGGSENMFFDGHGNGKAVQLASAQGWYFAAPEVGRGFDLAALTQDLVHLLDADPDRIFIMGYSMGAAMAISSVEALEAAGLDVAGMILMGGGRPVSGDSQLEALKRLPLLAQAGERDFARPGVEALIEQLQEAKHLTLTHRIVPDTEHLTAVQVGLDQAFEWMQWLLEQRAK